MKSSLRSTQKNPHGTQMVRLLALVFAIALLGMAWNSCSGIARSVPVQQDFTFVIFPDTQYMVVSDRFRMYDVPMWKSMCQWVVNNQYAHNIQAVLSVGDITDHGIAEEFEVASEGFGLIDAAGIPYVPIAGNHDYDSERPSSRKLTSFDAFFGPEQLKSKPWYGGSMNSSNANYYVELQVGHYNFLMVALEFFPPQDAVTWAADIIDAHPDSEVIILTHGYLNPNGSRTERSDGWGPGQFGLEDSYDGEELWERLIKQKPNIRAVICGHQAYVPHSAHRTDPGTAGNLVHQILIDYQASSRGDGWVGLLKFRPSLSTMEMSSYRTYAPSGLGYDPNAPTYSLPWPEASRAAQSRQTPPPQR